VAPTLTVFTPTPKSSGMSKRMASAPEVALACSLAALSVHCSPAPGRFHVALAIAGVCVPGVAEKVDGEGGESMGGAAAIVMPTAIIPATSVSVPGPSSSCYLPVAPSLPLAFACSFARDTQPVSHLL
jgi:hypothetical protein